MKMKLKMKLKDRWNSLTREQKALVGVGVVVVCVLFYAYHPILGTPETDNNTSIQNEEQPPVVAVPFPQPGSNNTTVSNNTTDNGTVITSEQAKNIAVQVRPGYTAQEPTKGSVNVNGTATTVWIVPLSMNNAISKTLYIDANTGRIVQET